MKDFLRLVTESNGGSWEEAGVQKDIKLSKKAVPSHPMGGYVKGEGTLWGFSPHEVGAAQATLACRKKCKHHFRPLIPPFSRNTSVLLGDEMLGTIEFVVGLNPTDRLEHVVISSRFGFQFVLSFRNKQTATKKKNRHHLSFRSRDVSSAVTTGELDDKAVYIVGLSVEDPRIPVIPTSIRAHNTIYGFHLQPVTDRGGQLSTRAQYISLSDVKGWIPSVSDFAGSSPFEWSFFRTFCSFLPL